MLLFVTQLWLLNCLSKRSCYLSFKKVKLLVTEKGQISFVSYTKVFVTLKGVTDCPARRSCYVVEYANIFLILFQGQEYAEQYLLEYQRRDDSPWIRFRDKHGKEVGVNSLLQQHVCRKKYSRKHHI